MRIKTIPVPIVVRNHLRSEYLACKGSTPESNFEVDAATSVVATIYFHPVSSLMLIREVFSVTAELISSANCLMTDSSYWCGSTSPPGGDSGTFCCCGSAVSAIV